MEDLRIYKMRIYKQNAIIFVYGSLTKHSVAIFDIDVCCIMYIKYIIVFAIYYLRTSLMRACQMHVQYMECEDSSNVYMCACRC